MFRMWCKMYRDGHLMKDMTVEDGKVKNRTRKVFDAVDEMCRTWDLSKPIWLEANIRDFKRHSKTRFNEDCFTEAIPFDFVEIHIIEED